MEKRRVKNENEGERERRKTNREETSSTFLAHLISLKRLGLSTDNVVRGLL